MLNPDSPIPLYHQLAERLMDQIRDGEYLPEDVMPSEPALAKQYGIGRPTVRQAMDILVRKGLVQRKRGAGTFVSRKEEPIDLFSLAGTSQAFSTRGIETVSKSVETIRSRSVHDDENNPFNGKQAFFMSRLTLVKREKSAREPYEPVLLEEFYLHPEMFRGIDRMDIENQSLSGLVSDHFYLRPESGRQRFKVTLMSERLAALFEMEPGSPILEVERTLNFPGADGAIFSRMFCRTDTFVFSQTMNLENNR